MDRRVGTYLHQQRVRESDVAGVQKQSLCIIETRENYWLPLVIQNALEEFSEWSVYVVGPAFVLRWVMGLFPGVKPIVLEDYSRSVDTFNKVMFAPEFWDAIQTEYILMFQCDTVFSKNAASKLPVGGKDFYGPVCGTVLDEEFVINGGLSYRKVSAFRTACRMLTDDDKKKPEDVAFTHLMRAHPRDFTLPTLGECLDFAVESFGNPHAAVGIHGTDKGYAPAALLASTLGLRWSGGGKVYDVFSYDGEPILKTRLQLLYNVVDEFVIIEARVTHAGQPKDLTFDADEYAEWMPKITYVVIDEFPPNNNTSTLTDSWCREKYQRDLASQHVTDPGGMVICGDVDEIPDPAVLAEMPPGFAEPIHLGMAFLVHQPWWKKREQWIRAFVCSTEYATQNSLTDTRLALDHGKQIRAVPDAGWHCSSFFDVDAQIRKVQHFAHREFAQEIDPETIKTRFETGKDPYGRQNETYDCDKTMEYVWLKFFVG